ncbi:MAG: hypothetical protein QXP05_07970 [Ignisphaera sp.]
MKNRYRLKDFKNRMYIFKGLLNNELEVLTRFCVTLKLEEEGKTMSRFL